MYELFEEEAMKCPDCGCAKDALKKLDGQLLQVAAEFARGTFLLNLEGCRTINDARLRLDAHYDQHQRKALQLKKQLDAARALLV